MPQTPGPDLSRPTVVTNGLAPPTTSAASASSGSTDELEDPEQVPDLAIFIAAIEDAMQDTSYEGAALNDPEVFIGVGQLFCELLDSGATVDDVLSEYLDALADEDTGVIADDDATMAGVLMGVSLEVICPDSVSGGE